MKTRKLTALILALAVTAAALAGCSAQKPAVAATYDGGEVPSGVYIYYQLNAVNSAYAMINNPYLSPQNLLSQKIGDISAEQWINDQAVSMTRLYAAIESEAARLGAVIDEESAAGLEAQIEATWEADGPSLEQAGVSLDSAKRVMSVTLLGAELFNAYYGENGSDPVPEEELRQYFLDNYRRSLMVIVPLVDQNTGLALEGEQAEAARAAFQSYKEHISGGGTIAEVAAMEQERQFKLAGLAEEPPEVVESELESLFARDSAYYPEGLKNMLFADGAELDTPLFYEDEQYLVIFDIRDTLGDGTAFENSKETLLSAYKAADFEARILQAADSINFAMVENYTRAFPLRGLIAAP